MARAGNDLGRSSGVELNGSNRFGCCSSHGVSVRARAYGLYRGSEEVIGSGQENADDLRQIRSQDPYCYGEQTCSSFKCFATGLRAQTAELPVRAICDVGRESEIRREQRLAAQREEVVSKRRFLRFGICSLSG